MGHLRPASVYQLASLSVLMNSNDFGDPLTFPGLPPALTYLHNYWMAFHMIGYQHSHPLQDNL